MKTIKQDEIYDSLNGFLKAKGIELSGGAYSKAVKKACGFLTEAVNLAQEGVHKTKTSVDTNLDKLRQTIHDATAKKPPVLKPKKKAPAKKKAAKKVSLKKAAPKKAVKKKTAAKKTAAKKAPARSAAKKSSARRKRTS